MGITLNIFFKITNIFTDFEVLQIENVIKRTYQHKENYLSMCFVTPEPQRHAENRNVSILIFASYLIQWTPKPNNGDKMYFCGRALITIKSYQARILIHLQVKIWITSNKFSCLVRLTSKRQAKLRVTLRNLLARFSAKRNIHDIDNKN